MKSHYEMETSNVIIMGAEGVYSLALISTLSIPWPYKTYIIVSEANKAPPDQYQYTHDSLNISWGKTSNAVSSCLYVCVT